MQHAKTQVVPQLGVALEGMGCLLKIEEGFEVLLVFVEGESHVVEDLCGSLAVEVADVLVRSLLFLVGRKWLLDAFAETEYLWVLLGGCLRGRKARCNLDALAHFQVL